MFLAVTLFGLTMANTASSIHTYTTKYSMKTQLDDREAIYNYGERTDTEEIVDLPLASDGLSDEQMDFSRIDYEGPSVAQTNNGSIFTNAFSTTIYYQYYNAILTGFKISSYNYGSKCSSSLTNFVNDAAYANHNYSSTPQNIT